MNNYKKTLQVLVGLFFVLVAFSGCKEEKKEVKTENKVCSN